MKTNYPVVKYCYSKETKELLMTALFTRHNHGFVLYSKDNTYPFMTYSTWFEDLFSEKELDENSISMH